VPRLTLVVTLLALIAAPIVASTQPDAAFDLLRRINALRRENGLVPLELNDQLSAAAQRHSQDMADTGNVDHTGSDGSTPEQRIRAAGYGPTIHAWGENIYGGGIATVDDAWTFWTTSTVHRANLLSERYREIGIGVATSANGAYFTLNFGARAGVLPFFVDQGSSLTAPNVTLTLSNEDAAPGGSTGSMGRAVEVRVGEGDDLSAVAWQAWQRSIPLTLSSIAGQHRISVEYRDARGTLATYFRIVMMTGAPSAATATSTIRPTIQPTSTATRTETPAPSATPTETPAPTATPTLTPSATFTPLPTVTPSAPPTALPQATAAPTPTPSATPNDQAPLAAMLARGWSDVPPDLFAWLAGLNVVAVIIGAAAIVRRSDRR
jgi:hypothetical protein